MYYTRKAHGTDGTYIYEHDTYRGIYDKYVCTVGDRITITNFIIQGTATYDGTIKYIDTVYNTLGMELIDGRRIRFDIDRIMTIRLHGDSITTKKEERMNNTQPDMINNPPHYQSSTGLEVIDVIKAFTENLTGIEATDTGNILRYICRWKDKNGLQDLEKCRWYINHLIEEVKSKEAKND